MTLIMAALSLTRNGDNIAHPAISSGDNNHLPQDALLFLKYLGVGEIIEVLDYFVIYL